jgi:hypothetical protein
MVFKDETLGYLERIYLFEIGPNFLYQMYRRNKIIEDFKEIFTIHELISIIRNVERSDRRSISCLALAYIAVFTLMLFEDDETKEPLKGLELHDLKWAKMYLRLGESNVEQGGFV